MTLRSSHHSGFTLPEIIIVVTIVAITTIVGIRQLGAQLDRAATRNAIREAGELVMRARNDAIALHTSVNVIIDTADASLTASSRFGRRAHVAFRANDKVSITTTRDSIVLDARGLGYGAANFTLVAIRNHAADTMTVSRLGRVQY